MKIINLSLILNFSIMTNKVYKIQKVIAEIIYLFLIFFFCYTAVNKLVKLDSFKNNLIKTTLFSKDLADVFSVVIIALEVFIILILMFCKKKGLLIFGFTMLIFTLYISLLRFKGLYEVCGCGGVLNGLKYQYHLLINVVLTIGSLYSFYIFNIIDDEK
ncbi:MauE/DoxX family redox-associated membrane protein [Flavobacterium sp. LS1R10]|uniref:MauE/DoxX family redox-associated membrane protein n=1 Tax=Flavobacterium sp. LS1R10 TaxID=2497482 RepID=UPI000F84DEA1|nr:MauE/DoxX family redox-associated membrane protein [Flavobacterium sp. LS1R10]RTY74323.1 hypothetical protein EKL96_09705 [Flavobacterium sp. LS1R10]